jgi:hypothetical protein
MRLGKLTPVDLRNLWQHEARNFPTWVAQPENLEPTDFSSLGQILTCAARIEVEII